MNYDEVMAIHNLKQKNIGDVLEESNIKDIQTLIDENCGQMIEINALNVVIDLMAEDMATDYHSKEWVINYYVEKINESIRNNTIQACKSKNKI